MIYFFIGPPGLLHLGNSIKVSGKCIQPYKSFRHDCSRCRYRQIVLISWMMSKKKNLWIALKEMFQAVSSLKLILRVKLLLLYLRHFKNRADMLHVRFF